MNDKKNILENFDQKVEDFPDRLAVKFEEEESLTYSQLDKLVNKIAFLLEQKLNINEYQNSDSTNLQKPIIPIYISKSVYSLASIYAILRLGLAYVFIDKNIPEKRVKYLLKQVNASVIIDEDFIDELKNLDCIIEPVFKVKYIKDDDLVCVCFTSGSTGEPKGVMFTYKNLSDVINTTSTLFDMYNIRIFLLISSFSFIAGQEYSLSTINRGGCLCIVSDNNVRNVNYLMKYIINQNIDSSFFPPQFAKIFLQYADGLLKTILLASDKVSNVYSNETILLNGYGSSETGLNTVFRIDKQYDDTPIGKPLDGVNIYLLDDNSKCVGKGDVGEICIERQMATGYLNDEKLTNEKFILNPYSKFNENRVIFRTGDLAYMDKDDDLVYVQRKDFMINIYGYRVNPSEVENALNSIEGVEESVVAGFDVSRTSNIENDMRIYAGVVTDEEINIEKMREELSGMIPYYMVPSVVERIDSVPVNSRGKLDRRNALPENIYDIHLNNSGTAELLNNGNISELENELFQLFSDILGHGNFGVGTGLLTIGFSSITLIRLLSKIFEEYGVELDNKLRLCDFSNNKYNIGNISNLIQEFQKISNIKSDQREYYPLTLQQILYSKFLKKINYQQSSEHITQCFNFSDDFDVFKLKRSLLRVVEVHSYLKTVFLQVDNKIYQKLNSDYQFDIKIHEKKLSYKDKRNFIKEFDYSNGPLVRFEFYAYYGEISLLFDVSHLIFDHYSLNIFLDDLLKAYNGSIFESRFNYLDYSVEPLNVDLLNKSNEYYLKQLEDFDIDFYSKPTTGHHSFNVVYDELDCNVLLDFCNKNNILISVLVFSVISRALSKFLKKKDILIYILFHGRNNHRYINAIGQFMNNVPILIDTKKNEESLWIISTIYMIKYSIVSIIIISLLKTYFLKMTLILILD